MTGLEYGNTRLRAMRSRLLDAADYERLAGVADLDRVLAALADADYGRDVEAAIARYRGLRRLDAAIRNHLVRCLVAMRTFYDEPAAAQIELLLQRWDARNLGAILRAVARPQDADIVLERLIPVGRIDGGALRTLAAQPDVRAVVGLLITWGIPANSRRPLRRSWAEYERTGDVAVIERALVTGFGEQLDAALDDDDSAFARVLRSEIDARNIVTALRYRAARSAGETPAQAVDPIDSMIPGGRISRSRIVQIITDDEPERVVEAVAAMGAPAGWRGPLDVWAQDGDLSRLADSLDVALARAAVGRFRGDPLGLDVPLAYTAALETEARNLRWVGRGIVHGLDPDEIRSGVVVLA